MVISNCVINLSVNKQELDRLLENGYPRVHVRRGVFLVGLARFELAFP
jgi:hypothetical protein